MVLFQLPSRDVFFIPDDVGLIAPFTVVVNIALAPEEFFGTADLTGRLRELPGLSQWQCSVTSFRGMGRMKPVTPIRWPRYSYSGTFGGAAVSIDGSMVTMRFVTSDLAVTKKKIHAVIQTLPALFAPISTTPIFITSMTGTVNDRPFEVRWRGEAPGGETYSVPATGSGVQDYFDLVMPLAENLPPHLVAAYRYLAQSFLLGYRSEVSYEFTGERLLNLCKAIQSIMPGANEDVDAMRELLTQWGADPKYIDVLSSVQYLRSQLDVAHIVRSPISAKAYDSIKHFVALAESCVQAFLVTALKEFVKNPSLYPAKAVDVKDPGCVEYLHSYLDLLPPSNFDLTKVPRRV